MRLHIESIVLDRWDRYSRLGIDMIAMVWGLVLVLKVEILWKACLEFQPFFKK
jgi:hypothetical protein